MTHVMEQMTIPGLEEAIQESAGRGQWPMVKLGDIADLVRGITFAASDSMDLSSVDSTPVIRAGNIQNGVLLLDYDLVYVPSNLVRPHQLIRKNDIIMCTSSGSSSIVGKCAIATYDWTGSYGAFNVCIRPLPLPNIDPFYLFFFLSSPIFKSWTGKSSGANIKNIRNSELKEFSVPLPPLPEQQRIVARLHKAQQIINQRKEQLKLMGALVRSLFYEMFGDPVKNEKGWEVKLLGECGSFKNGINYSKSELGYKIRCLGVGDFGSLYSIDNVCDISEISLSSVPTSEYLLQNGDIVFVRSNGNKELVGRSIEIYPRDTEITFSGFCIRFRNENTNLLSIYLNHALHLPTMRAALLKDGRGANIQNINQQVLSNMIIPLPPLALQQTFSDRVQQIETLKQSMTNSLREMEHNFNALMQEAFGQ